MVAFSPRICPSPFEIDMMGDGIQSADLFASNCIQLENDMLRQSLLLPPSPLQPELEFDDQSRASNATKDPSRSHKKLSHNAYERDRRKKLNSFYLSLRTLLPDSNQTKKLSIPLTVSRVVKYIPELQSQVARLSRRKEEILAEIAKRKDGSQTNEGTQSLVNASATCLNSKEVAVHITVLNKNISLPLSKFLRVLEGEGLQLMNASTFTSFGEKTFYNLHFQIKRCIGMEGQIFSEHLVKVIKEKARFDSSIQ